VAAQRPRSRRLCRSGGGLGFVASGCSLWAGEGHALGREAPAVEVMATLQREACAAAARLRMRLP